MDNILSFDNPDVWASTDQIIKNHGFEVEYHPVVTCDGHKIPMYRIPGKGQPIFLHTGLMCDSVSHVFIGERALAFSFAREGFDVYLPGYRGENENKSATDKKAWNYTFDDVAFCDIPKELEKVAEVSGKPGDIIFMGHSRGYFLGLMYLCNNPDEKLLRGLVGLSPIGYQDLVFYLDVIFRFVAPVVAKVAPIFNVHALFANPTYVRTAFTVYICPYLPYFCYYLYIGFSGMSNQFAPEDLLNFFSHFPSSLSMKELDHETQLVWAEKLQKYDHGSPEENMKAYHQTKPPEYYLEEIVNHIVALFYAGNDAVVTPEYVERQFNDLGTPNKDMIKIPLNDNKTCGGPWGHIDFIAAKDMTNCLFKPLLEYVKTKLPPRNSTTTTNA